jgi:hypothetical protein
MNRLNAFDIALLAAGAVVIAVVFGVMFSGYGNCC